MLYFNRLPDSSRQRFVALPRGAAGWSVVSDCGFS